MFRNSFFTGAFVVLAGSQLVFAHDTWVETHTNVIRKGDAIHFSLKLGNHGNSHRDFKLASKLTLDGVTLHLVSPSGESLDLRDRLIDTGYTPAEGYWAGSIPLPEPGLYLVAHSLDRVVNHGRPVRSLKSAKTCFVVSPLLDRVDVNQPGFDRVLGHPLELVPVTNPVVPMGPEVPIAVRLLLRGKPLPDTTISFIPRGTQLADGFDAEYECVTDAEGLATFTPRQGVTHLIVAHHVDEAEATPEYAATQYSATLTVFVPQLCPCCGE
jgi:uncharacterized GH25 family protein